MLWLVVCLASCAFPEPSADVDHRRGNSEIQGIGAFLAYLVSANEAGLIQYLGRPGLFHDGQKLRPEIRDFLYGEASGSGWKSIPQIAAMGKLETKVIQQQKSVITVLFFPAEFSAEIGNEAFLSKEWMRKYFACEFEVLNGRLELYQNVCFAETDGPFPPEYG